MRPDQRTKEKVDKKNKSSKSKEETRVKCCKGNKNKELCTR